MILFIALLLFTENVCILTQYVAPGETEFSRNVKTSVNKMSVNFSKIILNDLKPEGNFIFSPLNIYGALALVHLGATGATKTELSAVLSLPAEENKLAEGHENFGKLLTKIQNTTFGNINVNIANGIFVQKGLKLKESYLQGVANYYNSQTEQLDFAKGGPEATNTVNKWIADKTKNRIPQLFKEELSQDTVILLASALYFSAKWSSAFNTRGTQMKNFNTGVKQVQVPTMIKKDSLPYLNNKDLKFEAINIPYEYADFAMMIVLPYRDQSLKSLMNSLKPEHLPEVMKSFNYTYVNYEIPRMKFRWSKQINEHLTKLGIKQVFGKAELGNMVDLKNIAVSKVTHAAEIEVNEGGTTASAVTVVEFSRSAKQQNPNTPIEFHADRPFFFSIFHWDTNVILFSGVVQNPADENV